MEQRNKSRNLSGVAFQNIGAALAHVILFCLHICCAIVTAGVTFLELACSLQATTVAKHRTIGCELAFDLRRLRLALSLRRPTTVLELSKSR